MAGVERIGVDEARRHVVSNQAMLVCAYEDDSKCARILGGFDTLHPVRASGIERPQRSPDRLLLRLTCRGDGRRSGGALPGARLYQREGAQGRRRGVAQCRLPNVGEKMEDRTVH